MSEPRSAGTPRVFLASRNAKKLAEMQRILDQALPGARVVGLDEVSYYDEPIEDRPDFAGNAVLKAEAGFAATGLVSIADDSGLCVDALNGMPGVLSARWAGRPTDDTRNNTLLLDQLADVPADRRGAQFRCAVALVHGGGTHVVTGEMPGRIATQPHGSGGFGYDPLFIPDEQDGELTAAELAPAQKDSISHRGKALRAIVPMLRAAMGV